MKLSNIILKEDYWTRFKPEAEELESEMRDTYNRDDIHVTIIQHSNGDHARGSVQIMTRKDLRNAEYKNMKNFLKAKGFRITGFLANYPSTNGGLVVRVHHSEQAPTDKAPQTQWGAL